MTALKTYYQRKAETQQREVEATTLRADSKTLEMVMTAVQASSRVGCIARPMLLAGATASAVLAAIDEEMPDVAELA